jgi:Tfp pilus assembly protein PilF
MFSAGCLAACGLAMSAAAGQLLAQSRENRQALPAVTISRSANYVNPVLCVECHAKVARSYEATGMGRSFSLPSTANTIEDYKLHHSVDHALSGLTYQMIERNEGFFQRRSQSGFDGKTSNIVEGKIDYIIGSGNHARTYLHRNPDGTIVELPVSWYAERGGHWGMSPGYEGKDQEDFRRTITGECLFCHDGYPLAGQLPDRGSSGIAIFPKRLQTGIDCQRCHGPGGAHIRAVLAEAAPDAIREAIVNPARLDRERQLEVCMQCHLETSSGLLPNEIRRFDQPIDSFRPGDNLGDYKFYFERKTTSGTEDRFEIDHAAFRLRMSACFRKSQMTCLTCHDPHQSYRSPASEAHYLAACQKCHQSVTHKSSLPTDANCITCHMPERRTDDVVHVVMTDHYIQKEALSRDLLAPIAESSFPAKDDAGIKFYYPAEAAKTAENELYLATAEVMHGTNLTASTLRLDSLIQKFGPSAPEFYLELGNGYSKAGNRQMAIYWYESALRRQPGYRPAVKQLSVIYMNGGEYGQAIDLLLQAAQQPPKDADLFVNLGNAYLHEDHLAAAQQELERALELRPDQPEAQNLLGLIAIRNDNPRLAETLFRSAIRSQPDYAEAHNNLGNVLAGNHAYAEAEYEFKRAVDIQPGYGKALRSYGLMLALRRDYGQAVTELGAALKANPNDAQTHSDLANILAPQGNLQGAAEQYREAIHLDPRLEEAQCSLANVVAAQGKLEDAKGIFRTCLQLAPGNDQAHLGLGLILKGEGQIAEARKECEEALHSSDPQIRSTAESALRDMAGTR